MSEKFTPKFIPYTASDVAIGDVDGVPGWASRVKSACPREVRVGDDLSIEARLQPGSQWQPIMLPNGGTKFETAGDAARVVEMILGARPIPNTVTQKE